MPTGKLPNSIDFPLYKYNEPEKFTAIVFGDPQPYSIQDLDYFAELISNAHGGKGILLGGIPGISPTEVVIIGAGATGTMVARAAMALGASVKVFDNDIQKLRNIRHELGISLFTSILQPNVLKNVFRSADVVIGAMQYINKTHIYRISEDLIREMKRGALIIDLRMAQGGCFESTMEACLPDHPVIFEKYGVLHFCEMSLSSRVARTASMALSNILVSLITNLGDYGDLAHFIRFDRGFASGFYMYTWKNGQLLCGEPFQLTCCRHWSLFAGLLIFIFNCCTSLSIALFSTMCNTNIRYGWLIVPLNREIRQFNVY